MSGSLNRCHCYYLNLLDLGRLQVVSHEGMLRPENGARNVKVVYTP